MNWLKKPKIFINFKKRKGVSIFFMIKEKQSIFLLFLILTFNLISSGLFFILSDSPIITTIIYIVLIYLFLFIKREYTFFILVGNILGYGFYQIVDLVHNNIQPQTQFLYINKHLIFLLLVISMWLFTYLFRSFIIDYKQVLSELEDNKKYLKVTKLLTTSEIEYRLNILIKTLSRRKENAFIILVKINDELDEYKQRMLFDNLGSVWVKNIRDNYDLIGKVDDNTILVVLQNSKDEGLNIVMNRFYSLFNSDIDSNFYSIYSLNLLSYLRNKNKDMYDISDLELFSGNLNKEFKLYE